MTTQPGLKYSDSIAASRTTIALTGNPAALQCRLPLGWTLAPYEGDDLRGTSLRGANVLVPFLEVFATKGAFDPQLRARQFTAIEFISQARNSATGELGHIHWASWTEDTQGVPGKYGDGRLATITRSQRLTKKNRCTTIVEELFAASTDEGDEVRLALAYEQGGMVIWGGADEPHLLQMRAAMNPSLERWYKEDHAQNFVRSRPMNLDRVSSITLNVKGELEDVFDGRESIVGVVIQRPYLRHAFVP